MPDFKKHSEALILLEKSQQADGDNRDAAREAHLFIDKRDGQWEPYWWNASAGRPRYTFDMTGPIVDQISGEIEQADFAITIKPAGGDTTKENAKILDGLIRNIENLSGAPDIYNMAARSMVTGGIDGWQVKQKFVDDDSFDQDLVIEPIANFVDSVFFGPFMKSDGSDAKYVFVLEAVEKMEYEERFPKGSGKSLSQNRLSEAYFQKFEHVIIGQMYYITQEKRELILTSTGRVFEAESNVQLVLDELAAQGETVKQRRFRKKDVVKSRLFDGDGWLNGEQKTVFSELPVIPTIGNFKIFENKLIYRGVVEKLLDPQRVFNYSKSREIEEGSFAPRAKTWMTEKQAAGHEDELATLNTNADPVQFYNADPEAPAPPTQSGGAQINPGLNLLSNDMRQITQQTAGLFAANMGDNPGLQSGVAIEKLQRKGDTGTIKYFAAQERAICRTARILVDALPDVYDTQRQIRILKEDGTFDMTILNQVVFDQDSGTQVVVNDISAGKYDVTCSSGPSFQNRQQETVSAMVEVGAIDPSVIELGGDILFNNITAPGMDLIAARKRQQLFQANLIPFDQMTDEEKQQVQQAQAEALQNPPQPDPAAMIGQAELEKAQADTQGVILKGQIAQSQESRANFQAQEDAANDAAKLEQSQQQLDFSQFIAIQKQQLEQNKQLIDAVNRQAATLKLLREAMGVDSFTGPGTSIAFIEQARQVIDAQEDLN